MPQFAEASHTRIRLTLRNSVRITHWISFHILSHPFISIHIHSHSISYTWFHFTSIHTPFHIFSHSVHNPFHFVSQRFHNLIHTPFHIFSHFISYLFTLHFISAFHIFSQFAVFHFTSFHNLPFFISYLFTGYVKRYEKMWKDMKWHHCQNPCWRAVDRRFRWWS